MIDDKIRKTMYGMYIRLKSSRAAYFLFPREIQKDIVFSGKKVDRYYVQKFIYTGGLLLLSLFLAVLFVVQQVFSGTEAVDVIERPKAYEEAAEVALLAGEQTYLISVSPIIYSKEEAEQKLKEVMEQLEMLILGENEGLDCITEDLYLPDSIEAYPFDIYWESDREELADAFGRVNRKGLEEDTVVILKAVFYYEEWMWENQFGIVVKKELLEEGERYRRELEDTLLQSEKEQREQAVWKLPTFFGEEEMKYRKIEKDYTILFLAGLAVIAAIAVWIGQDRDIRLVKQKRQEIIRTEFSELVSGLYMYLSAGINLQTAVSYCARDYSNRRSIENPVRILLQDFQKNIANGYSFSEALEHFGEEADEMEYWKLANLLNQGLVHGSQGLADRLKQESERVWEEKRRQSKVRGEQISAALIAPMMLQLGIIFVLIMIPAFRGITF